MAGLYVGQKDIGTGPLGRREVVQEMHIPGCQYIRGDTDENLSGSSHCGPPGQESHCNLFGHVTRKASVCILCFIYEYLREVFDYSLFGGCDSSTDIRTALLSITVLRVDYLKEVSCLQGWPLS